MDGSHSDAAINLHTEFMRSDNIVSLFKKYDVPHPSFDHLTGEWPRTQVYAACECVCVCVCADRERVLAASACTTAASGMCDQHPPQ